GADRVEGGGTLVFLAAEQLPPGGRRHGEGHFRVREEQRCRVLGVVEALQRQLVFFAEARVVLDLQTAVLEGVDEVDLFRLFDLGAGGLLEGWVDVVARGRRVGFVFGRGTSRRDVFVPLFREVEV